MWSVNLRVSPGDKSFSFLNLQLTDHYQKLTCKVIPHSALSITFWSNLKKAREDYKQQQARGFFFQFIERQRWFAEILRQVGFSIRRKPSETRGLMSVKDRRWIGRFSIFLWVWTTWKTSLTVINSTEKKVKYKCHGFDKLLATSNLFEFGQCMIHRHFKMFFLAFGWGKSKPQSWL